MARGMTQRSRATRTAWWGASTDTGGIYDVLQETRNGDGRPDGEEYIGKVRT
jgi:hypothetical protein